MAGRLNRNPGRNGPESVRLGRLTGYRQAVFGFGWGLLTFHVDDAAELIRIFDLIWIG